MSRGVNKVIVVGNVGGEPDVHEFEDGNKVVNFSVAVNEEWKDRDGQRQEHTEWFRCVCRGGLAGVVERFVGVGDRLYLEGKKKTRKWQDKDGNDRYSEELHVRDLVMLGSKRVDEGGVSPSAPAGSFSAPAGVQGTLSNDPFGDGGEPPF
jgi:single-strand DNA-binding protein